MNLFLVEFDTSRRHTLTRKPDLLAWMLDAELQEPVRAEVPVTL